MPRGGKRDGAGRKEGSPNKATADIKAAAAEFSEQALAALVRVMGDKESPAAAQVAAANAILDRAHGKPKQALDVDANLRAVVTKIERRIVRPDHPDS